VETGWNSRISDSKEKTKIILKVGDIPLYPPSKGELKSPFEGG
jgi:hypothetical protein